MKTINDFIKRIQERVPEASDFATEGRALHFEVTSSRIVEFARLMCDDGFRLLTIAGNDARLAKNCFEVHYVFGLPVENILCIARISIDPQKPEFPSIMSIVYSARLFELEVRDMFGLMPVGNLDLAVKDKEEHDHTRRLVHHHNWPEGLCPLRKDFPLNTRPPEVN
ncbi:MAG TPA: NADH-quinone oxidoreductase subunit C, partial [Patescibacteria group bacterium]|nr:NADH-quinone oxidoreductase subunit C [Patescibacteria group bacterium]